MVRVRKRKIPVIALFLATFLCIESTVAASWTGVQAGEAAQTQEQTQIEGVSSESTVFVEEQMVRSAFSYIKGSNAYVLDGSILSGAGSTGSDWFAFGCGRYGMTDNYTAYLTQLENYVTSCYAANPTYGLSRNKATEWHRITFAVLACGGDPTAFGTRPDGSKINLIADGVYNCIIGNPWRQGINGAIYGLLALDAKKYEVPEGATCTREQLISYILGKELGTGGFALSGASADPDVTAMALQALAPYYATRSDVQAVVDRALSVLSRMQREDGGYASWGTANAESAAQVLVALCSLGIDVKTDARFVTSSGKTVLDGLAQFYDGTTGGFRHVLDGGADGMATQQAVYGLVAYLRFCKNDTRLYDFTQKTVPDAPTPDTPTPTPDTPTPIPDTLEPTLDKPTSTPDKPTQTPDKPTSTPDKPTQTPDKTKPTPDKTKPTADTETSASDASDSDTPTQNTDKDDNTTENTENSTASTNTDSTASTITTQENNTSTNESSQSKVAQAIKQDKANKLVTKAQLEAIIGTEHNLRVESTTDQGKWCAFTFAGADLTEAVDVSIGISSESKYESEITQLADNPYMISFAQTGTFPGEVLVELAVDMADGEYILFSYNIEKKCAEAVQLVEVVDGQTKFILAAGGEYFIAEKAKAGSLSNADKEDTATNTNGNTEGKADSETQNDGIAQAVETEGTSEAEQETTLSANTLTNSLGWAIPVIIILLLMTAGGYYAKKKRK